MGERQAAGVYIGNMGEVYREQGDHARATKCFVHALRIAVQLRDWTNVADQVANLAATAAAQGDRPGGRAAVRAGRSPWPGSSTPPTSSAAGCTSWPSSASSRAGSRRPPAQPGGARGGGPEQRARGPGAGLPAAVRLQVVLGQLDAPRPSERLRALEGTWVEPQERAPLLDALWELDPTQETPAAAAELYRTLYQQAPSVQLPGGACAADRDTLPPGPPLPPLPDVVAEDAGGLDELLRQVDEASLQLGAT